MSSHVTHLPSHLSLLASLAGAALKAGEVVLRIRAEGMAIARKADESPVTAADLASEELLRAELARLLPGVPVIAEEAVAQGQGETPADTFLLVDPLDGTREFIGASGEFTVNIGLVEAGVPTFGIVLAPAVNKLYAGVFTAAGGGAFLAGLDAHPDFWTPIRCRPMPEKGLVAVASRSHLDPQTSAFLAERDIAETISCGSALKFGLVAEGRADLYPRFGTVCEWDVAAGHAVVRAAGGSVCRPDGSALPYARTEAGYRVHGFIARGAEA
ncbi:3'(2'),5'-bisphosphate nucleotidase CysQ [Ancylobacter dichloromethanicus]|uniref:3'(2'),5'-bisphosphate nucleotidase CysQ n=1 Tax=Ancylobacter dichloromethanicus TaxID=518825 RepID=A0A9W6N002_9HYPH|nr:3'(2'),5'-bisphosphate nucleotidase CysQ [Ancylobacter dichloromethanicus]MBS7553623.1 3'(2'),5'-bisphosphate nucleotidase CysQ [Ancylobacter dichloromethanicus]GLK72686.1 3'(2'),5'-bisphosphate nucleotidase CysQ [Ancylobacter dichloromethanicus]